MSEHDRQKFEKILAFHSAPTLLGVKCANLISIDQTDFNMYELERFLKAHPAFAHLSVRFLCKCKNRVLLYVYQKDLLEMWFSEKKVAKILSDFGYASAATIDEKLDILEKRISCERFPHEIGIFLGYPVDDVLGFIKNQGKNCLFCGFWKVYSDPVKARHTFDKYVYCRDFLCNNIDQGLNLHQALIKFKEEQR